MDNKDELIALFIDSGGKFENMALDYREESGFYCYTLDSSRDSIVSCPSYLLVDREDIGIGKDGLCILNAGKYKKHRNFLEKYFAFHFNRNMLERYIEKKRQIDALTSEELSLLSSIYSPGQFLARDIGFLDYAKNQVIASHVFKFSGKNVLMPFVTFLNHDKHGKPFEVRDDAISVSGTFKGEVFARYNLADAITVAETYGFVTDTAFAYSLPMTKVMPDGTRICIDRKTWDFTISGEGPRRPLISRSGNTVTISWFPLYFEKAPLYPARVAQMVSQETTLPAEMFLYEVIRANLGALIPVAFQLRNSTNKFANLIAAAAQRQIEIIGGTRQ